MLPKPPGALSSSAGGFSARRGLAKPECRRGQGSAGLDGFGRRCRQHVAKETLVVPPASSSQTNPPCRPEPKPVKRWTGLLGGRFACKDLILLLYSLARLKDLMYESDSTQFPSAMSPLCLRLVSSFCFFQPRGVFPDGARRELVEHVCSVLWQARQRVSGVDEFTLARWKGQEN